MNKAKAKNSLNYLPQLIIGLDSLNDDANWVHIDDVRENQKYYCPCCKGEIKPRANNKNEEYKVQQHFFHVSGGCKEETFIHFICKNWLLEIGSKFIVNGIEYEVESFDTEKTLVTTFGSYRPDIVVLTTSGKVFYFEIHTTSKKTDNYIPKWDELGNDVIEVDTRYFINQKHTKRIPEFNLIYSEGECFTKSYSKNDYDDLIAKRKREWKRQDKINYKIQWERLDWFWIKLQEYTNGEIREVDILNTFNVLDYSDKLWCYYTIRKKSCIDLKEEFKKSINQHFLDMLNTFNDDRITISINQISPKRYRVKCKTEFEYLDYKLFEGEELTIKVQKCDILPMDYEEDIRKMVARLLERIIECENILNRIKELSTLPYVKSILPYSHWWAENYNLYSLHFTVEFQEHVHNRSIKESIGKMNIYFGQLHKSYIEELYYQFRKKAFCNLENDIMESVLKHNKKYQNIIAELKEICKNTDYLRLDVSSDNRRITLVNGCEFIFEYEYSKGDLFGVFEDNVKQSFRLHIERQIEQRTLIDSYVDLVSSCRNKLWKTEYQYGSCIILYLIDPSSNRVLHHKLISLSNSNDIKNDIWNGMRNLMDYAENYIGIRFMEVR